MRDRGWRFDKPVAARGYEWWYLDALSDDGRHGLTLIAFIGSVFSPWYRLARRDGGGDPVRHCAMNLALYGQGGHRWAMTERGAASLSRDADCLRIGPSSLRWDGTVLTANIDEVTAPWPSRLRGTIRLHPESLATHAVALDGVGRHRWSPIAPCARVEVEMRAPALRWQGQAYFDTNAGDEPLEEGFVEWDWCRAPSPRGTTVLYHGVRRDGAQFCTALRYDRSGRAEAFEPPPPADLGRSFWGMRLRTRADAGSVPRVTQKLEDAPFYARSVISTRIGGEDLTAVHESLSLDRFVAPWVQVMLPFKAPKTFFFEKKKQKTFSRLSRFYPAVHAIKSKVSWFFFSKKNRFLAAAFTLVGPQTNGSILASDNQLLTPAGKLVMLGSPVIAKAVAVNPNAKTHSAAVLLMKSAQPIIVLDTASGDVVQRYIPFTSSGGKISNNRAGSFTGVAYTPDGSKLLFSQDNNFVAVANVDPLTGKLTPAFSVALPPPAANPNLFNSVSANPGGVAVTGDAATALVALNANNTVGVIDLSTGLLTRQIPVGNAPNRIVVHGNFAYVSNEGGRRATPSDFTNLSDGTPIVADPTDAFATTGTVSVIDLGRGTVVQTINVGLHPAGLTSSGSMLYVANSYSDTVSVIDTRTNMVVRTIPVGVPMQGGAFGAGANDVAVVGSVAYVTLGQSNAVAVVDLANASAPVAGYIPTAYFPTTIAYDAAHRQLAVSDDKGTGDQGSIGTRHGVHGFNTHQETGTVSLIPLPDKTQLAAFTRQVIANNHWNAADGDVGRNHADAHAAPVAIPAHIGEPSLIKHVFLIIKENRTYDQVLGDVAQGNGDKTLAVFAGDVPNQHALIARFPLLDNMYAPSRQSADGHPWIVESGSFYGNDIQSADWIRSYPGGNSDDALTYTQRGFLWSGAEKAGLSVRMYGEWSAGNAVATKYNGGMYSWADFYNTHLYIISGGKQGAKIVPPDPDTEWAAIPSVSAILDQHYPSFNLGIPDQYRADYWIAAFQAQDARDVVPNLTIIWLPNDHTAGTTTGLPLPANYQADNDLALGRMVEAISRSNAWPSSAIFVEEDDAQDGVDHVDGHRQPAYVISPFTVPPQSPGVGRVIHTTYTQENINRTIENILGLAPLTQFDRSVSPMFDCFQNTPDTAPFTHVAATTPLNIGPGNLPIAGTGPAGYAMRMTPMQLAWNRASDAVMKGKLAKADAVDEAFLNHLVWYSATRWRRPYPGETGIAWPASLLSTQAAR